MLDRLIDLLIDSIKVFQFTTVIEQYQHGVVLRFGKYARTIGPGLRFLWPFYIEKAITDRTVQQTTNLGPQSLTTADGKSVVVSAIITHRIEDIRKALLDVEDVDQVLDDSCYGIIGHTVIESEWSDINSEHFPREVEKAIRRRAKKFGVHIIRVQFSDISMSKSIRLWGLEGESE